MAQDALTGRHRGKIVAELAFAGDHQDQSFPGGMGGQDKPDQGRMGLRKGHAVQVNPPLGDQFAAFQFDVGFGVHLHRRPGQTFGQAGQQVVPTGVADHLANLEWTDRIARGDCGGRFGRGHLHRAANIRGGAGRFVAPGDKIPQGAFFCG